jgi:hypothetical protein
MRVFCLTTPAPSVGLPWYNGSRTKECSKWSSLFAETLSKKEIPRPIQRPLGAV